MLQKLGRNCDNHMELIVWTHPQRKNFRIPCGMGYPVGAGTVCEYGFLQFHFKKPVRLAPYSGVRNSSDTSTYDPRGSGYPSSLHELKTFPGYFAGIDLTFTKEMVVK